MTSELVFGVSANQVAAYAAVAQSLLALALAIITAYYAWHARAQARASREQAASSNRQAATAQQTIDLLMHERQEQRRIDVSTVLFQIDAAIHTIDDWRERINSESFDLPEIIEIRSTNFTGAIANASRIDSIVSGYMDAALLYIVNAETDVRIMREKNPDLYPDSPLRMGMTSDTRKRLQERAGRNLNVARFKLNEARTRLDAIIEKEEIRSQSTDASRVEQPKENAESTGAHPKMSSWMNQPPWIIASCCLAVLIALYVVGAVSHGSLRHEVQTLPLWVPIVLGFRARETAKWAALPCLVFWLAVMILIWLFLCGWSRVVTGHFSAPEIVMTAVIGIASMLGLVLISRWRTGVSRLRAFGIAVLFAVLQLAAFRISLISCIARQ